MIALQALASSWQIDKVTIDKNFCQNLALSQLKCYNGQGDWNQLLGFNRPAIVQVTDHTQAAQWLALLAIDNDRLKIANSEGQQWLARDEFLAVWNGQFQFVWQSPPSYQRPLKQGDQGRAVEWLAQRLDFITGQSKSPESYQSQQFDQRLHQQVMVFQALQQLEADGIVGMSTLMTINELTIDQLPKLIN